MEKVDPNSANVIFFDGVCHLCNGFVDAVIIRDKRRRFRFAPLQGTTALELLSAPDRAQLDTVIYLENGKFFYKSSAILKVLVGLEGFYRLFYLAFLLPRPLRDSLYKFIAQRRYAWFGQRNSCRLPLPSERDYLLP